MTTFGKRITAGTTTKAGVGIAATILASGLLVGCSGDEAATDEGQLTAADSNDEADQEGETLSLGESATLDIEVLDKPLTVQFTVTAIEEADPADFEVFEPESIEDYSNFFYIRSEMLVQNGAEEDSYGASPRYDAVTANESLAGPFIALGSFEPCRDGAPTPGEPREFCNIIGVQDGPDEVTAVVLTSLGDEDPETTWEK